MSAPPTLHTFDPQIAGMVGLQIDAPATAVNQAIFYVSDKPGGPYTMAADVTVGGGRDGLRAAFDADATARYYIAKVQDSSGYSSPSNEIAAAGSAGPPPPPAPPTQLQDLEAGLGGQALQPGDQVAVYLQPAAKVLTVQPDGTLA